MEGGLQDGGLIFGGVGSPRDCSGRREGRGKSVKAKDELYGRLLPLRERQIW